MPEAELVEQTSAGDAELTTELVPPSDARAAIISIDPERLGGVPCFVGTRVPVRYLFEYLSKGKSLDEFLEDFEGVPRDEAVAALKQACDRLLEGLPQP
ncbi:MAG TPA: DUF433 domain-containing protein [Blastocatellia bacterium]|nr:DUF433 domain-containing protein [Blastocatellia bacterium]